MKTLQFKYQIEACGETKHRHLDIPSDLHEKLVNQHSDERAMNFHIISIIGEYSFHPDTVETHDLIVKHIETTLS